MWRTYVVLVRMVSSSSVLSLALSRPLSRPLAPARALKTESINTKHSPPSADVLIGAAETFPLMHYCCSSERGQR